MANYDTNSSQFSNTVPLICVALVWQHKRAQLHAISIRKFQRPYGIGPSMLHVGVTPVTSEFPSYPFRRTW